MCDSKHYGVLLDDYYSRCSFERSYATKNTQVPAVSRMDFGVRIFEDLFARLCLQHREFANHSRPGGSRLYAIQITAERKIPDLEVKSFAVVFAKLWERCAVVDVASIHVRYGTN